MSPNFIGEKTIHRMLLVGKKEPHVFFGDVIGHKILFSDIK
jgi:hypothetical protein